MQTKLLSEFLIKYIKDHLFNGRSIEKSETFDKQLQRVCMKVYLVIEKI